MAYTLRSVGGTRALGSLSIDGIGIQITDLYGDLNMNGNNIFGLPLNPLIPPTDDSVVTYALLKSVSAGLDPKESCRYVTVANIANFAVQATVEGALDLVGAVAPSLVNDDRVLVKNQADARENGIYWWQTASTSLVRAPDQDGTPGNEVSGGNYTFIENGDTQANTGWVVQGDGILVLGVDPINWFLFTANPAGNNVGGGAGVFRDITGGQTFNFRSLVAGANIGVTQNANTITIANTAANVTLSSAGGSPLPVDTVGPTLSVRGLTASGAVNLTSNASTIDLGVPGLSSAGGSTLVNNSNNMVMKGLIGGTNVSLTTGANSVTINATIPTPTAVYGGVLYRPPILTDGAVFGSGVLTIIPCNASTGTSAGGVALSANGILLPVAGVYYINAMAQGADDPGEYNVSLYNGGSFIANSSAANSNTGSSIQANINYFLTVLGASVITLRIVASNAGNMGLSPPVLPTINTFASIHVRLIQ